MTNVKPYANLKEFQELKERLENLEDAIESALIETGEALHAVVSFGEYGYSEINQAYQNARQRKNA